MLTTALGVSLLARRFGVRVPEEVIERAHDGGELSGRRGLVRFFAAQGIAVRERRTNVRELKQKSWLYPCIAPLKGGQAVILMAPPRKLGPEGREVVPIIDPANAGVTDRVMPVDELAAAWTGQVLKVDRAGDDGAARPFGWRWFIPELARHKGVLALAFVLSLVGQILAFAPIVFIQIALDKVVGYKATSTLFVLTGGVILAIVFNGLLGALRERLLQFIGARVEARLAGDAFDKVLGLPAGVIRATPPAQIEQTVQGAMALRSFVVGRVVASVFDLTGLFVLVPILLFFSVELTLVVLTFALVMSVASVLFRLGERRHARAVAEAEQARASVLRETVAGIEAVKTLAQDTVQRAAWRRRAAAVIRAHGARERGSAVANQVNATLQQLLTVAVVFVGVELVFAGALTAGGLIAVNLLAMRVVQPVVRASGLFAEHERAAMARDQMITLWNAPPEQTGPRARRTVLGDYALSGVTVTFPNGTTGLADVTLTIPARRRVAVIGGAGAGKTTLLMLLHGLVRASRGALTVDGAPIGQLDAEHYRCQVASLTAQPAFFHGTIEENLRRVRPNVGDREMEEALRLSGLESALRRLPDGLGTLVDDRASALSAVHRQKLALARALVADPRVLLIDEAFNAFDRVALCELRTHLAAISAGRGMIVATHDLAFVRSSFDLIVVLDEGRLAGVGTHDELLDACPTYRMMWDLEAELSAPPEPQRLRVELPA